MTPDAFAPVGTPAWEETILKTVGSQGDATIRALVNPWCPGLAVTMFNFGRFNVTHVASGKTLDGGKYERFGSAMLEMVQWALIARAAGTTWESDNASKIMAALNAHGDDPVPFPHATTTKLGVTEPMTVRLWIQLTRSTLPIDEFPWEGDDNPYDCTDDMLALLAPTVEATND